MILEEATKEAFNYYPSELSPKSDKPILAACELCGEFRVALKCSYHIFCNSCTHKSEYLSKKTKAKMSVAQKGNKKLLGHKHTEKTKALMSKNHVGIKGRHHTKEAKRKAAAAKKGEKNPMYGKHGVDSPNYKGGERLSKAKTDAKRKRELGYILLLPLKDGEVGHHVTDKHVVGIVEEVHSKLSGGSRKKHRVLVLEWLKENDVYKYNLVLLVLGNEKENII